MHVAATITGLYRGRAQILPGDSRRSAIFKQPVAGPVRVSTLGLDGDEQADRRVHGGPDKALHHYPAAHYAPLRAQFQALSAAFVPGSIGENLSTETFDDRSACIGDVYALGSARVQLCQPRTPCWKIDARYGQEGIAQFIEQQALAGWYYRVLAEGVVALGDALVLIERAPDALTLHAFNALWRAHRPPARLLLQAAQQPGLSAAWCDRLRARARWLQDHDPQPDA